MLRDCFRLRTYLGCSGVPHFVLFFYHVTNQRICIYGCRHVILSSNRKTRLPPLSIHAIVSSFVTSSPRQIIHYDENKLVKLGRQIDTLREALVESGEKLGYSDALAETYRLKTETSSSEFSELNNMLLRVSESLNIREAHAAFDTSFILLPRM